MVYVIKYTRNHTKRNVFSGWLFVYLQKYIRKRSRYHMYMYICMIMIRASGVVAVLVFT